MGEIIDLKENKEMEQLEGVFYSTIFKTDMQVCIEDGVDLDYAERCVKHFNSLDDKAIDTFCEDAWKYYQYMLEEWPAFGYVDIANEIRATIPADAKPRDLLRYLKPWSLDIAVPKEDIPAWEFSADCVWEPEHGLSWIQRGDKLLYVGQVEIMGPWADGSYFKIWEE